MSDFHKPIIVRDLDMSVHKAAKMLAFRRGIYLKQFLLDAIHEHCLQVATEEGLLEDAVIRGIRNQSNEKA